MFESSQNWELFGYDMRNLGRHLKAAWRDLLWAYDSPVRSRLDDAVLLRRTSAETTIYQAGQPSTATATRCQAVLMPDDLILAKALSLPLAVESELEDVLALEVGANSPFSQEDTAFGWRVLRRAEEHLEVLMVILSKSSAMAFIAQEYGGHDASAQEVWASVDEVMVPIKGFGEKRRDKYYRKRLLRVGAMVLVAALLLLLMAGTGVAFKRLQLQQLEDLAADTQREAASASRMRSAVSDGNRLIKSVSEVVSAYPSPHVELARLTKLLDDEVYLERLSVNGREIDLRGRAANAAAMMKLLVTQPEYSEVKAASPIRKIPGTSLEQFHLKILINDKVGR